MKVLLILVAICFSANALAQDAPPKVGTKPLARVKPKEPMACKLVGTVKGTKLWAGDCVASELRGAAPATETNLPDAAAGAIPPRSETMRRGNERESFALRFHDRDRWYADADV